MTDAPAAPVIPLPAPVDRRTRMGPFPSARAALRFLGFAAVGALLATQLGPVAWLPVLGGGFLLTSASGDREPLDERLSDFVRWELRRRAGPRARRRPARVPDGARVVRVPGDRLVAVVRAGGVPVAFLPPGEARRLFDEYRDLLRSLSDGLVVRAGSVPLASAPFALPPRRPPPQPDDAARAGYAEMVQLLCRRRRRREVDLVVWRHDTRPARDALDLVATRLVTQLAGLGVEARRLNGDLLAEAVLRFGWSVEAIA